MYMRNLSEGFNRSALSRFLNSVGGRVFRVAAGAGFLTFGYLNQFNTIGVIAAVWGLFPLSAGGLDICYISAALGGPLSGTKIRGTYEGACRSGQAEPRS
jgi:hypothetical protein